MTSEEAARRAPGETWVADTLLDTEAIMRKLQHRYPMLLIDRLYANKSERRGVGVKNVTINEPFFQGHFPGNPIMPGMLVVEALAQSAILTAMIALDKGLEKDQAVYFASIDKARFRSPVFPGDSLTLHVHLMKHMRNLWKFHGRAMVGERLAAEAYCAAALVGV